MTQDNKPKIGRFEISKPIGEGFQGKVYLGWDPDLGREVALKVITNTDSSDSEKIVHEAQIAAKVTHPNVIPIYDVGIYNGKPFLVFEFVDGQTLKSYLLEHGRLSEKEVLSIMVRIVSGLKCAHDKDIVHLDLSPNNFMIDKEGRPRIMDFGLSRIAASIDKRQYRTSIQGTPRYMSPEHINGEKMTPASDIFTLGLVFYELLTGKQAISENRLDNIITAVEMATIDWKTLQHQTVTPEVIAVIRDMLQVDPENRHQSAADLIPDIDQIIAIKNNEEHGSLAVEFLLRRLQRRPEFPVCSHKITEINRLTEVSSNTDFQKIGAVIIRDYALTNRILKIANSAAFNRGNGNVTTITDAIAKLGLNMVRMICNNLLLFKNVDDKNHALKDILVSSFISALIARHLANGINRRLSEEAFICALFHRMGYHLLAFYMPDEYEDIEALIKQGNAVEKAERAILSTTTSTLGIVVAKKWKFPDNIILSMKQLPTGKLEAPESDEEILCHATNFANELCILASSDSSSGDTLLKTNEFLERHQTIFESDLTGITKLTSSAAGKFSEISPSLGINYKNSDFCIRLGNFCDFIEESLEQEKNTA